jgi:hypothetical protein
VLRRPDGRAQLRSLLGTILSPVIALPIVAFAAWVGGIVAAGSAIRFWNPDLAKDTVIWFIVAGLPLLFGINDATAPKYFRHKVRQSLTFGPPEDAAADPA